jgi:hypothetical protein
MLVSQPASQPVEPESRLFAQTADLLTADATTSGVVLTDGDAATAPTQMAGNSRERIRAECGRRTNRVRGSPISSWIASARLCQPRYDARSEFCQLLRASNPRRTKTIPEGNRPLLRS